MNKVKKSAMVTLEITSWAGISMGAEHVYGYLHYYNSDDEYKREQVTFPMSQEEADALNKKDGYGSNWEAGEPSDRYMTEDALRADAIKLFHEKLEPQGYKLLVEGGFAVAQPQPVIAFAPKAKVIAQKFNDLYEQGQVIDWDWDKNFDLLDMLCEKWNSCIAY